MMASENLDCGYHASRIRHRRNSLDRRNKPDGMDQNDSYPSRTCSTLGRHHSLTTHMHWEELCSCASSTLQSSENLSKSPISHCELYTSEADHLDYPSPVVRLIPQSGASGNSGEPSMDMGHLDSPPSGLYHYWPDHQAAHFAEQSRCFSSVQTSFPPPLFADYHPSELESRLELLQSQLKRLETRMTADINVILQLLQRQIAPVPPAYSTVLPDNHIPDPATLYGSSTPVLHSMFPIPNIQVESRSSTIQSSTQPESMIQSNSQGSLSSGVHMGAASDDCEPDKLETNAVSTPALKPVFIDAPRLCASLRFPSLPGNLNTSSHPEDIQKHMSDPSLPVS